MVPQMFGREASPKGIAIGLGLMSVAFAGCSMPGIGNILVPATPDVLKIPTAIPTQITIKTGEGGGIINIPDIVQKSLQFQTAQKDFNSIQEQFPEKPFTLDFVTMTLPNPTNTKSPYLFGSYAIRGETSEAGTPLYMVVHDQATNQNIVKTINLEQNENAQAGFLVDSKQPNNIRDAVFLYDTSNPNSDGSLNIMGTVNTLTGEKQLFTNPVNAQPQQGRLIVDSSKVAYQQVVTPVPVEPTPEPTKVSTPEANQFVTRAGGMLQLRVQQDSFSPFQIKNSTFELNPAIPNADQELSDLTTRAFANAFGIDVAQLPKDIRSQMAQKLQGGLNDKNGKPIFSLMIAELNTEGRFISKPHAVDPFKGLQETIVPSDNLDAYPILFHWNDNGKLVGAMGIQFEVDDNGQTKVKIGVDRALLNTITTMNSEGEFITVCLNNSLRLLGGRNTSFGGDANNLLIPITDPGYTVFLNFVKSMFGSGWGPDSISVFK